MHFFGHFPRSLILYRGAFFYFQLIICSVSFVVEYIAYSAVTAALARLQAPPAFWADRAAFRGRLMMSFPDTAASSGSGESQAEMAQVHEALSNKMYWA